MHDSGDKERPSPDRFIGFAIQFAEGALPNEARYIWRLISCKYLWIEEHLHLKGFPFGELTICKKLHDVCLFHYKHYTKNRLYHYFDELDSKYLHYLPDTKGPGKSLPSLPPSIENVKRFLWLITEKKDRWKGSKPWRCGRQNSADCTRSSNSSLATYRKYSATHVVDPAYSSSPVALEA